ncbi:MAG: hypothetical protein AAB920_00175, partial [Patescibacteria group bacterium]
KAIVSFLSAWLHPITIHFCSRSFFPTTLGGEKAWHPKDFFAERVAMRFAAGAKRHPVAEKTSENRNTKHPRNAGVF